MTLDDVRKWWDERLTGESNPYRPYFNWLFGEAEKLEEVRALVAFWSGKHTFENSNFVNQLLRLLSGGKPVCTCGEYDDCDRSYIDTRGCPIHHKPESPQNVDIDEPDEGETRALPNAPYWGMFEDEVEMEGWWVEVNRAILWLRDRLEALDRGLKEHAKVALGDSQDIRYSLTDLRYRVEALEKRR